MSHKATGTELKRHQELRQRLARRKKFAKKLCQGRPVHWSHGELHFSGRTSGYEPTGVPGAPQVAKPRSAQEPRQQQAPPSRRQTSFYDPFALPSRGRW